MNLRKLSQHLPQTPVPVAAFGLAGILITLFAAGQILERVWAHAARISPVPGFGAIPVLFAGMVLVSASAVLARRSVRRAHMEEAA